eukprot:jgi/Ulvmu1/3793/UM018_0003.1
MNHPETFDKFVVPAHLAKVSYERDTKTEASGTFELQREDHTVGEPLVTKLHDNEKVHFAACKVPHPLEHRLLIKVKTHHASYTPVTAYNEAVSRLSDQLEAIKENFKQLVQDHCSADPSLDFDPASKFVQPDLYAPQDEYGAPINQDDDMVFEDGFGGMQ